MIRRVLISFLAIFVLFLGIRVYISSLSLAVSEDIYVRYQMNFKDVWQTTEFGKDGIMKVSSFFVGKGSQVLSARGEEEFEKADVEWAGVIDGKAVIRIPSGQKLYATKSKVEQFLFPIYETDENGFKIVGETDTQINRSTAKIIISGRFASIIGLEGVKGGSSGFLVVVDLEKMTIDVRSGIGLGGRFIFEEE